MELGPAYVPPVKKSLDDEGTRFQHVSDFIDYLNDGLEAVTNSLTRYTNATDILRKENLESALKLAHVYRNQLANMDGQKWDLNNLLDKCVPERGVLEGIRRSNIELLKSGSGQKSLPLPPDEDLQGV